MSAGDRDTLAELLAEHWSARWMPEGHECRCGQIVGSRLESTEDALSAHLADVIASSDWLREQRAEAKAAAVRDAIGIIEVVGGHDEPNIEKETAASWLERFAAEIVDEATEAAS